MASDGTSGTTDGATYEPPPAADGDGTDIEPVAGEDWDDEPTAEEPPAPVSALRRVAALLLAAVMVLAGAALWATLTTATGRRLAVVAVVVGILIGVVVRRVGRLTGVVGGVVAAVFSVLGAGLGQFAEGYALQANETAKVQPNWGIAEQWEAWGFDQGWEVFTKNLNLLSWLTLALAATAAYIYASDSGKKKRAAIAAEEEAAAERAAEEEAAREGFLDEPTGEPGDEPALVAEGDDPGHDGPVSRPG